MSCPPPAPTKTMSDRLKAHVARWADDERPVLLPRELSWSPTRPAAACDPATQYVPCSPVISPVIDDTPVAFIKRSCSM
jgi:hypothetical protein